MEVSVATGFPENFVYYVLAALYIVCLTGLFIYGTNCYVLLYLFRRNRSKAQQEYRDVVEKFARSPWASDLPHVTVQLPIFNERYVVGRLLEAACALDYPRERLEIQVLDDSTDDTVDIVRQLVARYQDQGFPIVHLHRSNREGFKAGALKEGMEKARGEFLAIFDADFVPPADFLRKTVPYFCDSKVGMVQARWDHINSTHSLLTRAQSIGIDGHFSIEQGARAWSGIFLNFNGTAGIWRRQAILDAGGWQSDTLTEDMDLSYRAQLAGWKLKYLLDVACPAELPQQVAAFKSQQFRWAKGSIQTARKIIPALLRARVSWFAKYQAIIHLTHYVIHPLMLMTILLWFPVISLLNQKPDFWLLALLFTLFIFATCGPSSLYVASQRNLYPDWRARIRWIPLLTLIGTGIALSNSRAILEGLFSSGGNFVRTPKLGLNRGGEARGKLGNYWLKVGLLPYFEFAVGVYAVAGLARSLTGAAFWLSPFLLIYASGFLYMALRGVGERWAR